MRFPGQWLLREDVAQAMQAGEGKVTAEQQAAHEAAQAAAPMASEVVGGVQRIPVRGVLTERASLLAMIFGGGNPTYEGIRAALARAEADPAVSSVVLEIDSPGGEVRGLFETLDAISALSKPITTRASMATSAAYALAAATSGIEATSRAAEFGSVGIVQTIRKDPDVVTVTSSEAPNKRPDPTTEEGKRAIQEPLDQMHALFVDAIASGRTRAGVPMTARKVNADFGRGGVLLAEEAQRRGMIDSLAAQPAASKRAERKAAMTKEELKAQHPAVYAAVLEEGRALGAKDERDRVCAHLELGEACGDLKIALTAVRGGEGMTQTNTAKYLAAGMNRRDISAKQADSDAASKALEGADAAKEGKDLGDTIADIMASQRGKAV